MTEFKFTASIIEALEAVLRLKEGTLPAISRADQPVWCNFRFFSRIKATPIRCMNDQLVPKMLERTVEFFYRGIRVAVVDLVGQKIDGDNDSKFEFWSVLKIGYFQCLDAPRWKVIELPLSLHGRIL